MKKEERGERSSHGTRNKYVASTLSLISRGQLCGQKASIQLGSSCRVDMPTTPIALQKVSKAHRQGHSTLLHEISTLTSLASPEPFPLPVIDIWAAGVVG